MHKPAQIELQLDRPQLPYSKIQGPIIAGGSPAHYRRRQPNPTKKGPYKHKDTKDINKGRDNTHRDINKGKPNTKTLKADQR